MVLGLKNILWIFPLFLSVSCTDSNEAQNLESQSIGEVMPLDSTGREGRVTLGVSNSEGTGFQLAEGTEEASLAIGENITLTYASFNVAKIKIKAEPELSTEEAVLEEKEEVEEQLAAENIEEVTEAAELKGKPDLNKIREKSAEYAEGEAEKIAKESSRDLSTKFKGPYLFDAITGKLTVEEKIEAVLLDGTYKRIQFQLKRNFVTTNEPIFGNVFALRGTVQIDEEKVPFEVDWHVALNFRMVGEDGFFVGADEENTLVIDFKIQSWFDGIDLSAAERDEDGIIRVNKTSNHGFMKLIHSNIRASTGFGKDVNGDKKVSAHEMKGKHVAEE